ncbi:solute carrier family 35 member G2a [Trichomycterus rosablanca]|uniref:solute carrier family 35 member G2a n=1 Tax=Trichomycterus rosablanca TaxID=2290929 RepID=UPI002F35B7D4
MASSPVRRLLGCRRSARIHPAAAALKHGSESYDDTPSFEEFGAFVEKTSDRKQNDFPPWSRSKPGGGAKGLKGRLQGFGEASALSWRLMWAALLGAAVAHGCVSLFARLLADRSRVPSLELLFVRSVLQLPAVLLVLRHREAPLGPPGVRLRLFLYGVCNVVSISCAYTSFAIVPPANGAVVWRASGTAFSAVLAFLLVDERLSLTDGVSASCGMLGLGLVLIPSVAGEARTLGFWKEAFGYVLMVLAGVTMALSMILYRCVKEQVSVWAALFTFGWVGTLWSCCSMFLLQKPVVPLDGETWSLLISICFCSTSAFIGVYYGLRRLHPALVSMVQHLELVVAMLLQLLVLHLLPSTYDLIGAAVIVVSVLALGLVKLCHRSKSVGGEYDEILDSPPK